MEGFYPVVTLLLVGDHFQVQIKVLLKYWKKVRGSSTEKQRRFRNKVFIVIEAVSLSMTVAHYSLPDKPRKDGKIQSGLVA